MMEWPATRRSRQASWVETSITDLAAIFRVPAVREGAAFRSLVEAASKACRAGLAPEPTLSKLAALAKLGFASEGMDRPDEMLALACVEVVCQMPSVETWCYLWSLAWHDASLAANLPKAVIAIAAEDPAFKALFLGVAAEVVKKAIENPGHRAIPRQRIFFAELRDHWRATRSLSKGRNARNARKVRISGQTKNIRRPCGGALGLP
jgi:hypothetical protein